MKFLKKFVLKRGSIGLVVLFLALFAAACGTSGTPDTYNETVRDNYIEGCTEGIVDNPDLSQRQKLGAESVCACTFRQIVNSNEINGEIPPVNHNIDFEDFEQLNEELLTDINGLSSAGDETNRTIRGYIRRCTRDCSSNSSAAKCQPVPRNPS